MPESTSKTSLLRQLISGKCVAMPGVFNAFTARLVEAAGFDAVYVSGAGLANATAGVPDIGLLGLEEVARLCSYIADATTIPAIADADTGFGGTANVARTVREMERVGLAGIHLEDQEFPKRCGHVVGKTIVPIADMTDRIKAAVDARRDADFLLIARTDARANDGFDAAVDRAGQYLAAGADAIFPEALQSGEEFSRFADSIDAPLLANMTEFGKSPLLTLDDLTAMGYRMAIFPQSIFRATSRTAVQLLSDLRRSGTQSSWLDRMQSRAELYTILDYDPAADHWNAHQRPPTFNGEKR